MRMRLSDIEKLKPKDINKMSIQDLKEAIKVAQYEQARRFKRMEQAGAAQHSPLYRGIENEMIEKGIGIPVSKNFKKLHNANSEDIDVLKNELREMIRIINRPTATVGKTRRYLKKEYERLFGDDEYYAEWWETTGFSSFWEAYEKAKEYGLVSAYGDSETQAMISEFYSVFNKFPSPEELEKLFLKFGSTSAFRKAYEMRKEMEDEIFTELS